MPVISNYAKGELVTWCRVPSGSSILVVCMKAAVSDATAQDTQYLQGLFDAGGAESTFTNVIRPTFGASDITVTTDLSGNQKVVSFPKITIPVAGGPVNESVVQFAIAWQPLTGVSNDSQCQLIATQTNTGSTNGAAFSFQLQALTAK